MLSKPMKSSTAQNNFVKHKYQKIQVIVLTGILVFTIFHRKFSTRLVLDRNHHTDSIIFDAFEVIHMSSFYIQGNVAQRELIIVTAATNHYDTFVRNLRCFVRQSSNHDIVLFAFDEQIFQTAQKEDIPVIPWYDFDTPKTVSKLSETGGRKDSIPHPFGSDQFSGISLAKLHVVRYLLNLGLDVIFTDTDTIWCDNIPNIIQRMIVEYPSFDIFIQSNTDANDKKGQANTGFYYAKSSDNVIEMFNDLAVKSHTFRESSKDDQTLFYKTVCMGGRPIKNGAGYSTFVDSEGERRNICKWTNGNQTVELMYLPVNSFVNGISDPDGFRQDKLPRGRYRSLCKAKKIALWHVNYCKSHLKEQRLKDQNVWISTFKHGCKDI